MMEMSAVKSDKSTKAEASQDGARVRPAVEGSKKMELDPLRALVQGRECRSCGTSVELVAQRMAALPGAQRREAAMALQRSRGNRFVQAMAARAKLMQGGSEQRQAQNFAPTPVSPVVQRYVKVGLYEGSLGMDHIGVGVNSEKTKGFSPKAGLGSEAEKGSWVEGKVKEDHDLIDSRTIGTNPGQEARLQAAMNRSESSSKKFHLYQHNCAQHGAQILNSVGLGVKSSPMPRAFFEGLKKQFEPGQEEAKGQPVQGRFESDVHAAVPKAEEPRPNRTGMPERLKAGIESLSGIDMSDVRVHTNSPKPARLNALAYTQGNQIYLGPGQERYLPHEAWHAVQQKQGRVRATRQMIEKVAVNDEVRLEGEADRMGDSAVKTGTALVTDVDHRSADPLSAQSSAGLIHEAPGRRDEPAAVGSRTLARGREVVLGRDTTQAESNAGHALIGHRPSNLIQQAKVCTSARAQPKRERAFITARTADTDARGQQVLSGPQSMIDGDTAAVTQLKLLSLPHPTQPDQVWEVDTRGQGAEYLKNWIDEAALNFPAAIESLIKELQSIPKPSELEIQLFNYARYKLGNRQDEPLVAEVELGGLQGGRQYAPNITPHLIAAHRRDYVSGRPYLQEGEGNLVARSLKVTADVFDKPSDAEPLIRRMEKIGEGPTVGVLLFVNGNHYLVLTRDPGGELFDLDNHHYRIEYNTVSDGDCLIDGLHFIRYHRPSTIAERLASRRLVARGLSDEDIRNTLVAAISDLLEGRPVEGLGTEVRTLVNSDSLLQQLHTHARDKRGKEQQAKLGPSPAMSSPSSPSMGEPVIGLEDVTYLGPTRSLNEANLEPEDLVAEMHDKRAKFGKPVHRGLLEVEYAQIDKKRVPCVRLYLTVVNAQTMTDVDVHRGYARSKYKDVQQTVDGTIVISSVAQTDQFKDQTVYINAGRPLRALKWAAKYIVEHQEKAERFSREAAILRNQAKEPQQDPVKASQLEGQARENEAQAAELQNPLIRSFLVPLDEFNKIIATAVHQDDKQAHPGAPENSDQQAAPNQYGFSAEHIEQLRKHAVLHSLITYSENSDRVNAQDLARNTGTGGGTVLPTSDLRGRIAVPEQGLREALWVSNNQFRGHEGEGDIAHKLTQHYGTWLQSIKGGDRAPLNPFLEGTAAKIPYKRRHDMMQLYLKDNGIDTGNADAVSLFMDGVVAPWASLGEATYLLGQDYNRLKDDTEVRSTLDPSTNAFGLCRANLAEIRKQQQVTGQEIDKKIGEMIKDHSATPVQILDLMIERHPELEKFYAESSNPAQGYRFYEHAQLVLEKYLQIARLPRNLGRKRSMPLGTVVKMILFHDMHKWSSRWQYGKGRDASRKHGMEEGQAEHVLPAQALARYQDIFGSGAEGEQQARIARVMVDGDPFGDYMKGEESTDKRNKAFLAIIAMARAAGIPFSEYQIFFKDLHEFYQADFSSYTKTGQYVEWTHRKEASAMTASKPTFDAEFTIVNDKIEATEDQTRLQYSQEKEERFTALARMFESEDVMSKTLFELDPTLALRGDKAPSRVDRQDSQAEESDDVLSESDDSEMDIVTLFE